MKFAFVFYLSLADCSHVQFHLRSVAPVSFAHCSNTSISLFPKTQKMFVNLFKVYEHPFQFFCTHYFDMS